MSDDTSTGVEPTLSVVLPNYNHARFLARALDALLAQSRRADEIIIVDDASSDESTAIVRDYMARHVEIVLIENASNQGAIRSLQSGLNRARSRYVYFAASDDYVLPGFFAEALAMLASHGDSGLYCGETLLLDGATGAVKGMRPVVRPLNKAGCLSSAEVAQLLSRADHFIHTGASIISRRAVLDKGGFDETLGALADGILMRKIALTHGMCFSPSPAAVWIIHDAGLSRQSVLESSSALAVLDDLPAKIAADKDFPPWYADVFHRRWRFASSRVALDTHPVDRTILRDMARTSRLDAAVVSLLSPVLDWRLGRVALLAWLTIRLRPFSLTRALATYVHRRVWRTRTRRAPLQQASTTR